MNIPLSLLYTDQFIKRYYVNLQINNFASKDVEVSWKQNGEQKSLLIPSMKNLTHVIQLDSVTQPDPFVISAKDDDGQHVLINLSPNVTIEPSQRGSDVTLNLALGRPVHFAFLRCYFSGYFNYNYSNLSNA